MKLHRDSVGDQVPKDSVIENEKLKKEMRKKECDSSLFEFYWVSRERKRVKEKRKKNQLAECVQWVSFVLKSSYFAAVQCIMCTWFFNRCHFSAVFEKKEKIVKRKKTSAEEVRKYTRFLCVCKFPITILSRANFRGILIFLIWYWYTRHCDWMRFETSLGGCVCVCMCESA